MPLHFTRTPPRIFGTVKAICPVCGNKNGEAEVSMPPLGVGRPTVTVEVVHAPAGSADGTLYAEISFRCDCGIRSRDFVAVVEDAPSKYLPL